MSSHTKSRGKVQIVIERNTAKGNQSIGNFYDGGSTTRPRSIISKASENVANGDQSIGNFSTGSPGTRIRIIGDQSMIVGVSNDADIELDNAQLLNCGRTNGYLKLTNSRVCCFELVKGDYTFTSTWLCGYRDGGENASLVDGAVILSCVGRVGDLSKFKGTDSALEGQEGSGLVVVNDRAHILEAQRHFPGHLGRIIADLGEKGLALTTSQKDKYATWTPGDVWYWTAEEDDAASSINDPTEGRDDVSVTTAHTLVVNPSDELDAWARRVLQQFGLGGARDPPQASTEEAEEAPEKGSWAAGIVDGDSAVQSTAGDEGASMSRPSSSSTEGTGSPAGVSGGVSLQDPSP